MGDTALIANLEATRAAGAEFLLVPASQRSLLERNPRFRRHLVGRYSQVLDSEELGACFALHSPDTSKRWRRQLVRSRGLDRTRDQSRSLDPGLEQRASARGRAAWMRRVYVPRAVTSPPRRKRRRGGGRPVVRERLAEATRVARHGVLEVPDDGTSPRFNASAAFFTHAPTVSIVIPCHEQIAHTRACIHALEETIPTWFRGEILIVDDASSPSTVADLQRARGTQIRT